MAKIRFPNEMPVANGIGAKDKLMISKDTTGETYQATWDQAKQFLELTGVELEPIASGALPTPLAGQTRTMDIVGPPADVNDNPQTSEWTHASFTANPELGNRKAVALKTGEIGRLFFNNNVWKLTNKQTLPKPVVANSKGNSTSIAGSQALVSSIDDKIDLLQGVVVVKSVNILNNRVNAQTGELVVSGYYGHYSINLPQGATYIDAPFANFNNGANQIGGAFYNSSGAFISGVRYFTGLAGQRHNIPIPQGATVFKNSIWDGDSSAPTEYRFVFDYINISVSGGLTDIKTTLNTHTSQINKLQNDVDDISENVNVTNYKGGDFLSTIGYYKLSDSTAPISPNSGSTGFRCTRFQVSKGQVFSLEIVGGGSEGRGYATTDNNLNILNRADPNFNSIGNPLSINILQDGWLYLNSTLADINSFKLIEFLPLKNYVDSRLNDIQTQVDSSSGTIPLFINKPIKTGVNGELRVLCILNSFTDDMTEYNHEFINGSTIDISKICLYRCTIGGSQLSTWVDAYNDNRQLTMVRRGGGITQSVVTGSLKQLLNQEWDVIIVQQISQLSNNYESIKESLPKLIKAFKRHCKTQHLTIGWQSIWSYTEAYNPTFFGVDGWKQICKTTIEQALKIGADFIIPTGTAIQNARSVSGVTNIINGGNNMTRDGYHLQYGTGRYIACATMFQKVFGDTFNLSILNNTNNHALYANELEDEYSVAVTDSNRDICLNSAFLAVNDMWNINNPS